MNRIVISLAGGMLVPALMFVLGRNLPPNSHFSELVFDLFFWPSSFGLSYPPNPGVILVIGYFLDALIIAILCFTTITLIKKRRTNKGQLQLPPPPPTFGE